MLHLFAFKSRTIYLLDLMENDIGANSKEMVLKCDLHESSIDPLNLLCGEYFVSGKCFYF